MINVNKELFQDFLDNNIVINCETEEEAVEFFKYCNSQKIQWAGGSNLLEYTNWNKDEKETCYDCDNMEIQYNSIDYYIHVLEKNVISYKELIERSNTYTGWQILKMIDERELKEGDKLINDCDATYIIDFDNTEEKLYLRYEDENLNIPTSKALQFRTFTIKEKEYATFDEARKSGKKFKYKKWDTYEDLLRVLWYLLYKHSNEEANNMLDEKAWEVED